MIKKGFTLVELIGVILLLSIVALIALPTVTNILKENDQQLYVAQLDNIKLAGQNWATDNLELLPTNPNGKVILTLGELRLLGYADEIIENPITDNNFSNETIVIIEYINDSYIYTLDESTIDDEEINDYNKNMPTIILYGDFVHYLELNKDEYEEPGYIALNKDGAIIDNSLVTVTLSSPIDNSINNSNYVINYTIEQDGYSFTAKRNVIVRDTVPPELYIGENIEIYEGVSIDLLDGVSATDNDNNTVDIETRGFNMIPGEKTVTYTAVDSSGNKTEKSKLVNVKMAELGIEFTVLGDPFNDEGWANNDFDVQIDIINKGVTTVSGYKWCTDVVECTPNTQVNDTTGNVTISNQSANNLICVTTANLSGYETTKCSEYYKLDKDAPIFNNISDVSVLRFTPVDLDESVTAEDSLSGLKESYTHSPATVDTNTVGTKNITYTATDKAGNTNNTIKKVIVGSDAPNITYSTDGSFNSNGWANTSFNISVSTEDFSGLGIKEVKYCLSSGSECIPNITKTTGNFDINITSEGSNRVCSQATDNYNNVSEVICSDTYKLDTTTSPVSITLSKYGVSVAASDSVSGIDSIRYFTTLATINIDKEYTGTVPITNDGTTKFYAYAWDNAGNKTPVALKYVYIEDPECAASTCTSTYSATYHSGAYTCYSSCPSGWTASGSQCYKSASVSGYYYCDFGWYLDGSTCYKDTNVYGWNEFTCVDNAWVYSGCSNVGCGTCATVSWSCTPVMSGTYCPTNGSTTRNSCEKLCRCSESPSVGITYSCSTGSLSGSNCYISRPTTTCYSPYYTCNSGDSLSGSTCTTTVDSCPSGYTYSSSLNTCYK